jgi:glycine cleavage system H protein
MNINEYVEINDCWVSVEDGEFYIGLLPSIVSELGSITYVDQIPMGKVLSKDGVIGILETGNKGDWPLKSPVVGQVTKFNTKLNRKPNLVSDDTIGDGWIIRCKIPSINNLSELGEIKNK